MEDRLSSSRSSFGSESYRSTQSSQTTFEMPMGQRSIATKHHDHGKIVAVLISLLNGVTDIVCVEPQLLHCSRIAESAIITGV